jgi:hypothetical protein
MILIQDAGKKMIFAHDTLELRIWWVCMKLWKLHAGI